MRSSVLAIVAVAVAFAFAACGGEVEREHTATTVRGSYGDPPAYDPCPGDDAGADADADADAGDTGTGTGTGTPDGC